MHERRLCVENRTWRNSGFGSLKVVRQMGKNGIKQKTL